MRTFEKMIVAFAMSPLFAAPAFAQSAPTTEWKMTTSDNPTFPRAYQLSGCFVNVRADGAGVTLSATDYEKSGDPLTQTVIIERNKWGGASADYYWYGNSSGRFLYASTFGYDVFYMKCRDAALKLPADVRRAFLGYYGL